MYKFSSVITLIKHYSNHSNAKLSSLILSITMRRSRTTVPQRQRSKMELLNDSFSALPRSARAMNSAVNASWDHDDAFEKQSQTAKRSLQDACLHRKSPRNLLLQAGDIDSLLGLLHTNKFAGKVDLEHHSNYMREPKLLSPSPRSSKKRIMMRSSFQSDTHLLNMKGNAGMVPRWEQQ